MNPIMFLLLILVIVGLPGCSGTFTEARLNGAPKFAVSLDPPECQSIESARRGWDAAGKTSAFLAGGAGLATIPVRGEAGRISIISGAVGAGAFAIYSMVEADAFAKDWVRQCGATGVK